MTYAEVLRAAWEDHLAPKAPDAPTVVSTFAGCGGSSLGYSMAGYRELLAVEWDEHAASMLRRNFPRVEVFQGSIADYDPAMLGLEPGVLDVFDGSPPCQGFSTLGARQIDDPRNQLFREYIRLLTHWMPRAFVMENVAGMVKGEMKSLFAEILADLKRCGYRVSARLLDASYLGVPQARPRLIFIGVRDDLGIDPVHPAPMLPRYTVRDAFQDLTNAGLGRQLEARTAVLSPHLRPGMTGSTFLTAHGKKGNFHGVHRLRWDEPAPTVVVQGALKGSILHPDMAADRCITTTEMCRLQSFPDAYDWGTSTYKQIGYRVGNSVPPLMMRAIARTLRERVLDRVPASD